MSDRDERFEELDRVLSYIDSRNARKLLASIKAELAEKDALLAGVTERMRVVRPAAERLRLENRQLQRELQEARELLDRLWDTANLTTVPADVLSRLRALQRTASNQEGA